MKTKKIISFLLCIFLCTGIFSACGGNTPTSSSVTKPDDNSSTTEEIPLDVNHGIADQSKLFGICYLIEDREYYGSPFTARDFDIDFRLIENLGAKTVRHWMHFNYLLTDKQTINVKNCETMHKELAESEKRGLVAIGMNHHNFNNGSTSLGKVRRNLATGSYYKEWLDDYYTSWYTLVKEFPEVTYWEMDNEPNNPDFMYDYIDRSLFTSDMMADIYTDMMYYASRAIHDANPNAKSVMGGLTEPLGQGKSNAAKSRPSNVEFLQRIYDNIASGEYGYFYSTETNETASLNPDDYFDIAAWHPYRDTKDFDPEYFIQENHKVYQAILDNEQKHKKVFITEVGYSDTGKGDDVAAANVMAMMKAFKESMPYVETVNIFRLFDNAATTWAAGHDGVSRYGFFADPDPARAYKDWTLTTDMVAGAPKILAYEYQKAAGGKGSLDLLTNYYANKNAQKKQSAA